MKKNKLLIVFLCFSLFTLAQENRFTLSGGYVFANIEETDTDATGWRLNALYEFNPSASIFSHGIAFGYIGTSVDYTSSTKTSNFKVNSWPVYYAPRVTLGKGNLKGFLKGALGSHITGSHGYSQRKYILIEINSTDVGFYGGLSAGGMLKLGEKVFIIAEYEWAYMSNSYYRDGFVNSVMGGIGFKF